MRKRNDWLSRELDRLSDEIQAEHDAVELSPWNLTLDEVVSWDKEESDWDKGKRDYTEIDVWESTNYKEFNEASLGQVYKHYLDSKKTSFCLITAYVPTAADTIANSEKIKRENKSQFSKLKTELSGYGYFNVRGISEITVDGKKQPLEEPTLFVLGISLSKAKQLAIDYHQWGMIFCGPETKGSVRTFYTKGGGKDLGDFHPGKIAAEYSKVRGRPFVFESDLSIPRGFMASSWHNHMDIKEIPGVRKSRKYISKELRNWDF